MKKTYKYTLIELVAVIVVLAIVAVIAIPEFVDFKSLALDSVGEGVFGAANEAASLNFAKGAVNEPTHDAIVDGATLAEALTALPSGWFVNASGIETVVDGKRYIVYVGSAETDSAPARLIYTVI